MDVSLFYDQCKKYNVDFFTGVPDSLLKDFCAYLSDCSDNHVIASNEGAAIGLASGYHLATNKYAMVYMQNSGMGNAINPLLSLADNEVYSIPMLLLIGWRGEPGKKDEPQHIKQGKVTLALLEAMDIPYVVLSEENNTGLEQLAWAVKCMIDEKKPVAIVVRKQTFGKYNLISPPNNPYTLTRETALGLVVDSLESDAVVVSTTGMLSRELFEYRENRGQPHGHDFLTVGSMGHASQIALGIALQKKERRVYCLDGDGSLIMHMGSLATIGTLHPENFIHVLFNNGSHDSVGGQETVGFSINFVDTAKALGYKMAISVSSEIDLISCLQAIKKKKGALFLEVKILAGARENLGRPSSTPKENKLEFIEFLRTV